MRGDPRARLVDLTGGEKVRLKAGIRHGLPVVRLDLLAPVATHSDALSVIGSPLAIPLAAVSALIEVLDRTRAEIAEAEAAKAPEPEGLEF